MKSMTASWKAEAERRFRDDRVGELTGATLDEYLLDPAHYDNVVRHLMGGGGLNIDEGGTLRLVEITQ